MGSALVDGEREQGHPCSEALMALWPASLKMSDIAGTHWVSSMPVQNTTCIALVWQLGGLAQPCLPCCC